MEKLTLSKTYIQIPLISYSLRNIGFRKSNVELQGAVPYLSNSKLAAGIRLLGSHCCLLSGDLVILPEVSELNIILI